MENCCAGFPAGLRWAKVRKAVNAASRTSLGNEENETMLLLGISSFNLVVRLV